MTTWQDAIAMGSASDTELSLTFRNWQVATMIREARAPLTGALAAIIADPDCCAASKAIARGVLSEEAQRVSDAEAALDEIVQIAQAAGDYGTPKCQPQDTASEAIQALIDNYSTAGANLLDWLDASDLAAMPKKRASEQQWRGWGSDVACRATFRALRQAKDAVAAKSDTSTGSTTKPVTSRPAEPADLRKLVTGVWYRGWECSYDEMAGYWTGDGYFAALGGADADCIHVRASTWSDLLDEIDGHEKTEQGA